MVFGAGTNLEIALIEVLGEGSCWPQFSSLWGLSVAFTSETMDASHRSMSPRTINTRRIDTTIKLRFFIMVEILGSGLSESIHVDEEFYPLAIDFS